MATSEQWKAAARRVAQQARKVAIAAMREADRLIGVARQRAESSGTERRVKEALRKTGRILKAAGAAAVKAGVAAAKEGSKKKARRKR